jgi:tetratricopeptide (TPR) repeat protein
MVVAQRNSFLLAKWAVMALAVSGGAVAEDAPYGAEFSPNDKQFGPLDYYTTKSSNIALVERYHMGIVIAEAKRLKDDCSLWHNLDYTLRAIPNHPQALQEMANYLERGVSCYKPEASADLYGTASDLLKGRWRTIDAEDYFRVALNFMTRDTHVIPRHAETHVLYADWLRKKDRMNDAMEQYNAARALKPGYANTYYGLGMLYLDQMNVAKAAENARKAYSLGKPPTDLRERLVAAGAWPAPTATKKTSP